MSSAPSLGRAIMARRRGLAALLMTVGAVAGTLTTAEASNAGVATPTPQHCVIVVGKAAGPNHISPELYHYCSRSPADPRLKVVGRRVTTPSGPYIIDSSTVLMIWWENASYSGNSTVIYGGSGPCDAAGYSININLYWSYHLSSIQGTAYCNIVQLTKRDGTMRTNFLLPVHYLGVNLNDNVGYVHVWQT